MKRGEKTLLVLIALLFIASLGSPVSKVFFADGSVVDQAMDLQDQVSEIEKRLDNAPENTAKHATMKDELLEVREKVGRIIARENKKNQLHWWNDILFPLFLLLFFLYHFTTTRRTEHDGGLKG